VEVPPSNFAYRQGSQLVFGAATPSGGAGIPPAISPGVSVGAAIGINLLANVVASGIEAAAAATAREAVGPVGDSILDLDLRATVIEQLRALTPPGGPTWAPSDEAFPSPESQPREEPANPTLGRRGGPAAPSLTRLLAERAKTSAHEATLFIRVLPLFRGLGGRAYVNGAAMLIDKSGKLLAEWNTQLMAPEAPDLERPEVVRWWAEGRYRQFMAQGLRAVLVPLAEEIGNPALRTQRQAQLAAVLAVLFDESGRPADPLKSSEFNASRMRSTPCILQAEQRAVTYRYERTRITNVLLAAAYCAGEKVSDWSQDVEPGLSWTHEAGAAPTVITRGAK
jgi:hypothetical protein